MAWIVAVRAWNFHPDIRQGQGAGTHICGHSPIPGILLV
jgi:hypothetical protein